MEGLAQSLSALQRSLRRRGLARTLQLAAARLRSLATGEEERDPAFDQEALDFDAEFQTDTSGLIPLDRLAIESENLSQGVQYQPSPPDVVREALGALEVDYDRFTFVDLGAGKGMALLIASELEFKSVVGVEFSTELCDVAERNLASYPADRRRCQDVRIVHADALEYQLPAGPLVIYLFSPFEREAMAKFVARLEDDLERRPREAYVLYYVSDHRELFDDSAMFERARDAIDYVTYHHDPLRRSGVLELAAEDQPVRHNGPDVAGEPPVDLPERGSWRSNS